MKYIDAEKLITEIKRQRDEAIERQKKLEKIDQETVLNEMLALKLNGLLSFIDSLQQEQPEVDLKTEYDEQFDSDPVYGKIVNRYAGIAIARHFYELGRNARKEKSK